MDADVSHIGGQDSGFRVQGLGFQIEGAGLRGLGFQIEDLGFRAEDLRFRIWSVGGPEHTDCLLACRMSVLGYCPHAAIVGFKSRV